MRVAGVVAAAAALAIAIAASLSLSSSTSAAFLPPIKAAPIPSNPFLALGIAVGIFDTEMRAYMDAVLAQTRQLPEPLSMTSQVPVGARE